MTHRNHPPSSWTSTLFERLDRWLWKQEHERCERYLAAASDRFDLEQRLRRIDRGNAVWF